jgi:hypothetical protein
VHVTNDLFHSINGTLSIDTYTFNDQSPIAQQSRRVEVNGSTSSLVMDDAITQLTGTRESTDCFVSLRFEHTGNQVSDNIVWLGSFKEAKIRPVRISIKNVVIEKENPSKASVTLESSGHAFFTWIEALGVQGSFDDNVIHLFPDTPRKFVFRSRGQVPLDISVFRKALQVRSLSDAMSDTERVHRLRRNK